jgi:hypothetical protein
VSLVAAPLLAASLGACGGSDETPDYQGVCVDPQTQERVPDRDCDDGVHTGGAGFLWWYLLMNRRAPAVGAPLGGLSRGRDYVTTVPAGRPYVRGGVPPGGGTVTRASAGRAADAGRGTLVTRGGHGGTGGGPVGG